MRKTNCEYEQEIVRQTAKDGSGEQFRAHLAQCNTCQEALKTAVWMRRFAATTESTNLPKAGFILWKARIIERQTRAERATQPFELMHAATIFLVFAAVVWMLVENQNRFAPVAQILLEAASLIVAPLLVVSIGAACVCLVFAFIWRRNPRNINRRHF